MEPTSIIFSEKVALPVLNPQSVIFSFSDVLGQNYLLVNHSLLIFKCNNVTERSITLSASKALNVLSLKENTFKKQ